MNEVRDFSTAYPDILLLVENRSEEVERVVDSVSDILKSCGFRVHIRLADDKTPSVLLDYYQLIVCGDAAAETAINQLVQKLQHDSPDLSHLAFGVLEVSGTRERSRWESFRRVLEDLGAVEVVDPHQSKPRRGRDTLSAAQYWALDCVAAFSEAFAPVDSEIFE